MRLLAISIFTFFIISPALACKDTDWFEKVTYEFLKDGRGCHVMRIYYPNTVINDEHRFGSPNIILEIKKQDDYDLYVDLEVKKHFKKKDYSMSSFCASEQLFSNAEVSFFYKSINNGNVVRFCMLHRKIDNLLEKIQNHPP